MKIWGVFEHIEYEVDGDRDTIKVLRSLCSTEGLAIKKQNKFEEPSIERMHIQELTSQELRVFFKGYSHREIIIEE